MEDQMDQESRASTAPDPATLTATRRRLHGIGECLMAGPQRRAGGRFTLRVTPGGFATTGAPALRLDGTDLVIDESRRLAVAGTFAEMAHALGVDFGAPPDNYPDGSEASPGRQHLARPRVGSAHPGLVSPGRRRTSGHGTPADSDPVA